MDKHIFRETQTSKQWVSIVSHFAQVAILEIVQTTYSVFLFSVNFVVLGQPLSVYIPNNTERSNDFEEGNVNVLYPK